MLNGRIYEAKPTKLSIKYDHKIYSSVVDVARHTGCYYDVINITKNGENSINSTKIAAATKRLQQNP